MPVVWREAIRRLFTAESFGSVYLAGIGNPIKRDDSAGLYIITQIRRKYRTARKSKMKIIPPSRRPELLFSGFGEDESRALLFDAVECNKPAGSIIFAPLSRMKYGFFATHDLPIRVVPSLQALRKRVFFLGIQPENTEIGNGLTPTVKSAADSIVEEIGTYMEAR